MRLRTTLAALTAILLAGCNTHQSTLAPFGEDAADIRQIAIVLLIGAVVIAAGVAWLMRRAVRAPEGTLSHEQGMKMVLWLGGVAPVILLGALLLYALPAMRPRDVGPADLHIAVEGEQFWWRVTYRPSGGTAVETANEVRVPIGRTVEFALSAKDVVHSFWVPGLAGKMDMIPGRTNKLVVRATKPGRYRGVCAEFCGLSHALMAFDVVAMEPAAFDAWLAAEARPVTGGGPGAALFDAYGCAGCHAIRERADTAGAIGPDLTHFGSRQTLAAGILPMITANVASFIRDAGKSKPGARMPAFPQMTPAQAQAIARYLQGLK